MCVVLLIDTCIEICTEVKIKFIIIALSAAVFKHMLPIKLLYFEVKSRHFQKLHVYPFELPQQLPGCGNFRKICSAEIDSLHKTVLHTFQIFEHAVINRFDCKKKIQKFANTLSFYPTGLKLDCLTLRAMVPNKESNFEQYQPMYSVTSK